jgi:hypothetical protein
MDVVCLLHAIDDAEHVFDRRVLGVERHDDPPGDGVHLRPLHALDCV